MFFHLLILLNHHFEEKTTTPSSISSLAQLRLHHMKGLTDAFTLSMSELSTSANKPSSNLSRLYYKFSIFGGV